MCSIQDSTGCLDSSRKITSSIDRKCFVSNGKKTLLPHKQNIENFYLAINKKIGENGTLNYCEYLFLPE